ncbi:ABC transporter ATP-binding protein [Microbacterium sp.]|jgi:ABC-2 type transport system ATP-binding protein|uniref:ABC transporter ATP-binding protein n=1 Tax=Microbacterium sp. TaxID=51671 RepID=UPI0037C9D4F3
MTPGIEVTSVRRSFAEVQAVRDATLVAHPGRVTALVGPNGSGKTTLLLMLASLLSPDAGEVRIGGVDPVSDPQGARALLGWMPDALGAWPSLTARETLVTTARLYRIPHERAAARAGELIELVGLGELADAPARVLSRGQKQRLGLARALVHEPSVLLLDEPASGLDPRARVELRHLLRRLAAEGRTILVSSHVLSELEEVADDAVFMVRGETVGADRVAAAASRLSDWRVRFTAAGGAGADAVGRIVAALPEIDGASVRSERRDILIPFASESDAAAALARLVAAGLPVAEFAPATGALERTFLDLGEDLDAGPGNRPGTERGEAQS